MSLEVASKQSYIKQHIFYVRILQTMFSESFKFGDGGALYISSNIQGSIVHLDNVTFTRNVARGTSKLNPGRGGAIFTHGESLFILIEHCEFKNNFASDSGHALYTSKGVSLSINKSYFITELSQLSVHPIMHLFGTVKVLLAKIDVSYRNVAANAIGIKKNTYALKTPHVVALPFIYLSAN